MFGKLLRKILRKALIGLVVLAGLSILWVLAYRVVPPPVTALMIARLVEGHGIEKDWTSLDAISPHLVRAVMGAEDSRFCRHSGFDWEAIQAAFEENQEGRRLRGGSTISQQMAKNAFLWSGRSYLRKGLEAWFTGWAELLWPKRRIMAVYLNIVEWGPGIYGAEAAARAYFGKPAAELTERQAALMAAVLPNPLRWSPAKPTDYIARRAGILQRRMAVIRRDGLDACIGI